MKKLMILLLAALLLLPAATAAQWGDGLSAAKPYSNVPQADLDKSMGYTIMYPWQGLAAERFCDVLEIYLPREDVELGAGKLTLVRGDGKSWTVDFSDPEAAFLRPLGQSELEGLMWGGGVCVEAKLPVSLDFDGQYHVSMDEGCFTAAGGAIQSPAITAEDAWVPEVVGDYGVGGLYYGSAASPTLAPKAGDAIGFNLLLGGDAARAVIYCEDDSVAFDAMELDESGPVTGAVVADAPSWGVVFLDETGEVLDVLALK